MINESIFDISGISILPIESVTSPKFLFQDIEQNGTGLLSSLIIVMASFCPFTKNGNNNRKRSICFKKSSGVSGKMRNEVKTVIN